MNDFSQYVANKRDTEKILRLFIRSGWSHRRLVDETGIDKNVITRFKRGHRISLRSAGRIALALSSAFYETAV